MKLVENFFQGTGYSKIVEDYLFEAQGLQSKKLYDIFQKYKRPFITKHYDSSEAMDLHSIKDEDVVGVFPANEIPSFRNGREEIKVTKNWIKSKGFHINPEDGYRLVKLGQKASNGNDLYVVLINRGGLYDLYDPDSLKGDGKDTFKKYVEKKRQREKRRLGDGAREYQWKDNGEARHLTMRNPYYKDWGPEAKERLRQHVKDTYGNLYTKVTGKA